MGFKIELDIFSGRPNPYWILSKKQETMLNHLLSNLIQAEHVKNLVLPDLGYRGFKIYNPDYSASYIRAYKNLIKIEGILFLDANYQIENHLLKMGSEYLDSQLLDVLKAQL